MKNNRKYIIFTIIIIIMIFNCKKDKDKKSEKIEVQEEVKVTKDTKDNSNSDKNSKVPDYNKMIIGTWQTKEKDSKYIFYENGEVETFEYDDPIPFSPMQYKIEGNIIHFAQNFDLIGVEENNPDVAEIKNFYYDAYFEFINDHELVLANTGAPEEKETYIKIE